MKTEGSAKTNPNFQDADAFYEALLDAHSGLSRDASELLNARLILIMANQLGDSALLQACIATASQDG
ncbi:MAG: DUF2783 domain-containing protein [Polaromonas sp.]|nr:DUF2783 domain-containing protein [Polaromonas sp.]